jgi:hypothetical protein
MEFRVKLGYMENKRYNMKELGSLAGIEQKLSDLVEATNSYIKSRETQDARWTVTREQGQKISVLENCTDNLKNQNERLESYLKSDDPMRPWVLKQIEIRLQRLENTIAISNNSIKEDISNNSIKEELDTFKSFIMKIIYSIGGGITAILGLGGLITWIINIIK